MSVLQGRIDEQYRQTWDGLEVEIPPPEEGGEPTKEVFRDLDEEAFGKLGRDRPKVYANTLWAAYLFLFLTALKMLTHNAMVFLIV